MFGFLLKIGLVAVIVAGVGGVAYTKKGNLPSPDTIKTELAASIKNFDSKRVAENVSASLDTLVSNPSSNSPVVLGVKITNDSINSVVDTLQNLPPDQMAQIKSVICSAPTPSSASSSLR